MKEKKKNDVVAVWFKRPKKRSLLQRGEREREREDRGGKCKITSYFEYKYKYNNNKIIIISNDGEMVINTTSCSNKSNI